MVEIEPAGQIIKIMFGYQIKLATVAHIGMFGIKREVMRISIRVENVGPVQKALLIKT